MVRHRKPPSQTFLENHATDLLAIDFFTVPTARFRVLFVLVVLSHNRREIAAGYIVSIFVQLPNLQGARGRLKSINSEIWRSRLRRDD